MVQEGEERGERREGGGKPDVFQSGEGHLARRDGEGDGRRGENEDGEGDGAEDGEEEWWMG